VLAITAEISVLPVKTQMSDSPGNPQPPWFLPVPRPFWSAYSEEPFDKCVDCGEPLANSPVHIIQKRFVAGEAVFEMAICEGCRQSLVSEYSTETRRNIENYLTANGGLGNRIADLPPELLADAEQLLQHCMNQCVVCETPREKCHKYTLAGGGSDLDLIVQISPLGQSPVMICDDCETGMQDLVSQQTRDRWNRFIEDHFDGPPGVEVDSPWSQPVAF
jgi:hypothetical protein